MNRWTGTLAIPQEEHRVYLTPTPAKFENGEALVARCPVMRPPPAWFALGPPTVALLETPEQVDAALDAARKRTPRLPLVSEDKARAALPADCERSRDRFPSGSACSPISPKAAKAWIAQTYRLGIQGTAEPEAQGRDRLRRRPKRPRRGTPSGHARQRLNDLGFSDDAPKPTNPKRTPMRSHFPLTAVILIAASASASASVFADDPRQSP